MVGQNNYRYRLVATGACGPVTSNAAVLTVNPLPSFSLTGLNPAVVCVSDLAFTLVGPGTGTWSGTGVQGGVFNPATAGIGTTTVNYTQTVAGCSSTRGTIIQVNECSDRHLLLSQYPSLIVYPNPSNGAINVRVNTDLYTELGLKIYNSDGQLVQTLQFSNVTYGSVLPVNLVNAPSGTYHFYFHNSEHGFTSKGVSVIIYHK
jgi:hypothetical protein